MWLSARVFGSKNRRTSLQMTPRRLTGQSLEEQIRRLQSAWGDVLSLPLCLVTLALYEWWRWLFSIPSNPLLLTVMAAVAVHATWRRRTVYKAELKLLRPGRSNEPMMKHLVELLGLAGTGLRHLIRNIPVPSTLLSPVRRALSPANGLVKRLAARW